MSSMVPQLGILCTGLPAAFLAGSAVFRTRRWAYVLGLAGQPFWFWTAFEGGQWGLGILCCCYTTLWARGFRNHWLREPTSALLETADDPRRPPRDAGDRGVS